MSPSAYAFPSKILIKISGRSGNLFIERGHFIRARAFRSRAGIRIDAVETYAAELLKR